jgi:pimeloyl-ACP methyl ester carboxylesterase
VKRVLRIVGIALISLVLLGAIGFVAWTRVAGYTATAAAGALARTSTTKQGWIVFQPTEATDTALVFYPGALVEPAAYAPLMKQVADRGVMTVIVPMPLDLAIFGIGSAGDVMAAYPRIKHWIIGGHSLGGSMAAEFVKAHPTAQQGVVFLASYSADSTDLSGLPIRVVSIYGTNDGLAAAKVPSSMTRLPADAVRIVIDGGNHAQFGDYGAQRGDGTATISRQEQQSRTAVAIRDLADSLTR